jgi:hypothetical protein
LVPCPRIVEPWTPPATAPRRRQPAPAASSGRGRRGDPTPRATSQPRPATSTTENTTRRPFPPTKQPSPAKSPNAVDEGAQGHSRQPRTALEAAKPQVSTVMRNQHHRERGHGPGREAGHFAQVGRAWRRCTAPTMTLPGSEPAFGLDASTSLREMHEGRRRNARSAVCDFDSEVSLGSPNAPYTAIRDGTPDVVEAYGSADCRGVGVVEPPRSDVHRATPPPRRGGRICVGLRRRPA